MPDPITTEERARRYLARLDPAVSGRGGHNATFRAACVLVIDFDLPEPQAARLLAEFNQRCLPPWSDKDLQHKLAEAIKEKSTAGNKVGRKLRGKGAGPSSTSKNSSAGATWPPASGPRINPKGIIRRKALRPLPSTIPSQESKE